MVHSLIATTHYPCAATTPFFSYVFEAETLFNYKICLYEHQICLYEHKFVIQTLIYSLNGPLVRKFVHVKSPLAVPVGGRQLHQQPLVDGAGQGDLRAAGVRSCVAVATGCF